MTVKQITTQPVQVCFQPAYGRPAHPHLLANLDLLTVIRFSELPQVDAGSDQIPPLGTIVIDGDRDVWAATLAGTAQLQVTKRATQWTASPAQIAAQIALSGVPLLSKSTLSTNTGATSIGGGGTQQQIGPLAMGQTGYEIFVSVTATSGLAQPFLSVLMQWSDSATGLLVAEEQWWLAGAFPSAQQYTGTGPTKGDTLLITVTNDAPSGMTYDIALAQNSRAYARDDWRQITNNAVPNNTAGNTDAPGNFLFEASPNVAAGNTLMRIVPLYAGRVTLHADSTQPFDITIGTNDQTPGIINVNFYEGHVTAAGGGFLNDQLDLPRSVCGINLTNNGGSAAQIFATLVISEQLP